jgi:Pectinacetylesterase
VRALRTILLGILALGGAPAPLWAGAPVCGDSLYLLENAAFTAEAGIPAFSTVRVSAGRVHLEGCGAADARVDAYGATIRARWPTCGQLGQVSLKMALRRRGGCARGIALITGRSPKRRQARVRVTRATNPVVDPPAGTWTWLPTAGMRCADGSPTGIGVNPSPTGGNRLTIFMMGGGGCWDAQSCYQLGLAFNVTGGYGEAKFGADFAPGGQLASFNRALGSGGIRRDDANWVFVPYCTGDLHMGDAIRDYEGRVTFHVGAQNALAALDRIQALYPVPDRVSLSGSSAGGFGVAFHWAEVARRYAGRRVDMLNDCGVPILQTGIYRTSWNVTYPSDCTGCTDDPAAFVQYQARQIPSGRGAILGFLRDPILGLFGTLLGLRAPDVAMATIAVAEGAYGAEPNLRSYLVDAAAHVMLRAPDLWSQNGVALLDWLAQLDGDGPMPASVRP